MAINTDWKAERARVAALSRSRAADDPELLAARQRLTLARAEDYITRVLEGAPPLSQEQLDKLAGLFATSRSRGEAK